MKPALSLIISVYKNTRFLELILESLQNQSFKNFEVLIADDGSGAEMKECIQRYADKKLFNIRHIWHEDNGFRKTIIVNKAVAQTQSDYLVFIDGDCILHHRFLEMHYKFKKPGHILSGRRVNLDENGTQIITPEIVQTREIEKFSFWKKYMADERSIRHGFMIPFSFFLDNLLRKHYYILGCNQSMHKADFISINGYDESIIGRGMEDTNLEARLKLKGYRIMSFTRKALQYHLFHSFDPVPHDKDTIYKLRNPESYWAKEGIDKYFN